MFKRSLSIGSLAGINIRLHWSLLLGFLYFYLTIRPETPAITLLLIVLLVLLFGCVTLHELGHALAARRYGIATREIVLWTFGGLAVLEREPDHPQHELVIAAAGPLVNLLIVAVVALLGVAIPFAALPGGEWAFYLPLIAQVLIQMNLALVVFNLIPIYPLDGGRMLRAVVSMGIGQERANRILFVIGVPLAIGLLLYFLINQEWLSATIALLLIFVVTRLNPQLSTQLVMLRTVLLNRGDYYFMRNDYERAIGAYTARIARRPDDLNAYHNRGASYHHMHDFERALADYNQVIAGDPQRIQAYIDRAQLHLDRSNATAAMADVDHLVALHPDDPQMYVVRAIAWLRVGDRDAAAADLSKALAIDPDSGWNHNVQGVFCLSGGDTVAAEAAFNRAVELAPGMEHGWINRGLLYLRRGDIDGAYADFAQAIAAVPQSYRPWAMRGVLKMRTGDVDGALADLEQATNRDAGASELVWHRARIYDLRGDTARVEAEIAQWLARDPEEACIHSPSWLFQFVAGDLDWALRYYAQVLALRPNLAAAYHGRADAWRVNERYTEALADYTRALELDPARIDAYLGRALAAQALGLSPAADADRILALSSTPDQRRAAQALLDTAPSQAAF